MVSEWELLKIEDIGDVKSGKRLPKGHSLISDETPFPYIRLVDISDGKIRRDNLQYLTEATKEKIQKYVVNKSDVCLAIVGHTIGMVFYVSPEWDNNNLTENAARITNIRKDVVSRYLYYFLISPQGQTEILSRKVGSAQGKLPLYNIKSLEVLLPPLPEQKAIANILGSLDDKIELNRQMNETLEAMAQALFKSWFVDFDPVLDNALAAGNAIPDEFAERAKQRQAVEKTDNSDIYKLFPDEFEFTEEMGWIPKGWDTSTLDDLTTELRRGISPKYTEVDGVRVVNQRCIRNHSIDYSVCRLNDANLRKIEGRHLEVGDVLVNSTGVGTLGRMAQVCYLDEPTVVDSHVTVVRPNTELVKPHTFGRLMLSIEPLVESMGLGSTGQTELSRVHLGELVACVPSLELQGVVEKSFSSYSDKSAFNLQQNITLAKLRDTLLPKLMSGELRIADAAAMVN